MTYTDVSLAFRCAIYNAKQRGDKDVQFNKAKAKDIVIILQKYIRTLDGKLVAWKQSVNNARGKYYELNYFTTLQLLYLRKELGSLTQPNTTHTLKPNVLMLLKSVTPQVTSRAVIDSLQAITQPESMDCDEKVVAITTTTQGAMESTFPPCEKQSSEQSKSTPLANLLLPLISYRDLTDYQQKAYAHCVDYLGCSESHFLRALDECEKKVSASGKKATIYDMEQWCVNNEDSSPPEEECSVDQYEEAEMYDFQEDSDSDEDMGTSSASQTSNGEWPIRYLLPIHPYMQQLLLNLRGHSPSLAPKLRQW